MLRAPDQSRLTVTNQTSLAELKRFSEQAGGNAKIRGDRNADGSITLYASTKKGTGLAAKLGRDRVDHQAAAREAVNTVLSGVKGGGQTLNFAMTHVKGQLPAKGELRGAGLAAVVQGASAAREHAVTNARDFPQIGAALAGALAGGNAETVKHLTAELGGRMAAYMMTKSPDQQMDFVISRGDGLKGAALGALCAGHDGAEALMGAYANDGPLKAVLDDAYQQATQRLPNHQNGDGTLDIGGKTYAKDRHLTEGGFGSVDIYKATDGEEIAVKTPKGATAQERAEKFDEAAREVDAHRSAFAGNPANVVGLKGVVRTPEGGIQIALEFAARGDAYTAIDKLNAAAAKGDITPREANLARLTILKDMIQGLRHVQETRGMTHLDVKSPNYFVDAGGVVKLGDFGTAKAGNVQQLLGNPIDNPIWTAPEVIKGDRDRSEQVKALTQMSRAAKNAALAEIDKTLSPDDQATARQNIVKKYDDRIAQHTGAVAPFSITSKADTWSVGVEAYRLFTNKPPFDDPFMTEIHDKLVNFASDPTNRVRIPDATDTGLSDADLGHLNALIGGLMHPDPQQRITLSQALQSPVLQHASVGGAEARAVIQQITT